MQYIVKMDGEKIRSFNTKLEAAAWARKHCKSGKVEIVSLAMCKELPRASSKVRVNLDMPDLRYKPFVQI